MIPALLAALALGAADPCAPIVPAASPDPASAAAYRKVGDAEEARGDRDTAALAWRTAASLDPSDRASRAALARLCAAPAPDRFRDGLARMDAGDLRGAIVDFRAARARRDDPQVALLEGICHYELGEDGEAEPLLRDAASAPGDADLANLYLGLVALRSGATTRAASLFDAASASAAVAPVATDLARAARGEGPWTLTIATSTGWDSNVNLAPPGAALPREASGLWAVAGTGTWRPRGSEGPYLRAEGLLDQRPQATGYGAAGGDLAGGWQLRLGAVAGLAEYDFGYRTLGGSPFLSSHRLLASAWTVVGGATVAATYLARFESYAGGFSPFSGTVQAGELRTSFAVGPRARLALAYGVGDDAIWSATYPYLSFFEHGPRAELRLLVRRNVRLGADVAATFRRYAGVDPYVHARRADTYLDGGALVEWQVAPRWTADVALRGRVALSNVSGYGYDKLVPTVGLAYTFSP